MTTANRKHNFGDDKHYSSTGKSNYHTIVTMKAVFINNFECQPC